MKNAECRTIASASREVEARGLTRSEYISMGGEQQAFECPAGAGEQRRQFPQGQSES